MEDVDHVRRRILLRLAFGAELAQNEFFERRVKGVVYDRQVEEDQEKCCGHDRISYQKLHLVVLNELGKAKQVITYD